MSPRLALVVAMARARVIGRGNDLPWHIPEDLRRFKALTIGKPVIMGRKTFESIMARLGRPLPGRTSIVLTRGAFDAPPGVVAVADPEAALEAARREVMRGTDGTDEISVIGGAQIYALFLPHARRIYMTEIDAAIEGDAFFPALDPAQWVETERIPAREPAPFPVIFRTLDRVGGPS